MASGAPLEVGVNLEEVTDWGRSFMFADAMRHSRPWGSLGAPHDELAPVDPDGWPTGDAGVVVMVDVPGPLMAGTYRLGFRGNADVGGTVAIRDKRHDPATNVTRAEVDVPSDAEEIILTFSGQPGGVKDVRLVRPGHGDGDLFYRPFLERLAHFSVIRSMDYLATNGNPQVEWSDRTLPTHASQQRRTHGGPNRGASWELLVELANRTRKDLWVNVPDQASDDYVRHLARLLHDRLDPGRKIYVEWSNEVWNDAPDFLQTRRNYDAVRRGGARMSPPLGDDGQTDVYVLAWRRIARRGAEVSEIFRSVFGDAAMMTRVRPILASQLARPEVLQEGIEHVSRVLGPPSRYFWGCGAAYYVGADEATMDRPDLDLGTLFGAMERDARRLREWMAPFSAWCRYHRLGVVAYEGGQHLTGEASLSVKLAAQRDPRMKAALDAAFQDWASGEGGLLVYFNLASPWGRFGSWGLAEDVHGESTPKWEAVRSALASPRAAPAVGTPVPAHLAPRIAFALHDGNASASRLSLRGASSYAMFHVRAPLKGTYVLRAEVSGPEGATVRVLVDSEPVATWAPTEGSPRQASVSLSEGPHVIRLQGGRLPVHVGPLTVAR